MEVKFYKKASYGTLEIARKEVVVQQDPCKYKVWSITKGTDQEYPAQKRRMFSMGANLAY